MNFKQNERRVLAIITIILAILALIGAWIPFIGMISFVIAVIAFILGVIALILNRNRKRRLSTIGTTIASLAIAISLITQVLFFGSISSSVQALTSLAQVQSKTSETFDWNKEQYDELTTGDSSTGEGGVSYDTIISEHNQATSEVNAIITNKSVRTVTYTTISGGYKYISLTFIKQDDGSYLLSQKSQIGLNS